MRGGGGDVEREGIPGIECSLSKGPGVRWDWGQGQLSTCESLPTGELYFRYTVAVNYATRRAVVSVSGLLAPQSLPSECMGSICDNSDCSVMSRKHPCQLQVDYVYTDSVMRTQQDLSSLGY